MILMNFRSSRSLSWAFSCNMMMDRTLYAPRREGDRSLDRCPLRPRLVLVEVACGGCSCSLCTRGARGPWRRRGLQRVRSRMGAPPRRRRLWRIKVSSTEGADPEPHAAGQAPRVASGLAREMRGHLASHKEGPSQNLSSNQSPRLALQESLTGAAPVTQRRWPSSDPVTATAPPVRGAPGAQQGVGLEAAPSFGPTLWS